jgi:broad specificity phosphatase PhoE
LYETFFSQQKMTTTHQNTRFGLIRHAETVWNREKRIQGQSDFSLTAAGKRQAVRWGRQLKALQWDRLR